MLYIVSTPIGNLGDITFRAIYTLKYVDIILVESLCKSIILLKFYNIKKKIIVFNIKNENEINNNIKNYLLYKKVAIICDSGTPLISDPGYTLVNYCINKNIKVISIPGATSIICSLTNSGFPIDKFIFLGFLSKKKEKRIKILVKNIKMNYTIVIFESCKRLISLLNDIKHIISENIISISKELTKKFEFVIRGKIIDIIKYFNKNLCKGEIVIVISKKI